jgi:hypothetical protein
MEKGGSVIISKPYWRDERHSGEPVNMVGYVTSRTPTPVGTNPEFIVHVTLPQAKWWLEYFAHVVNELTKAERQ